MNRAAGRTGASRKGMTLPRGSLAAAREFFFAVRQFSEKRKYCDFKKALDRGEKIAYTESTNLGGRFSRCRISGISIFLFGVSPLFHNVLPDDSAQRREWCRQFRIVFCPERRKGSPFGEGRPEKESGDVFWERRGYRPAGAGLPERKRERRRAFCGAAGEETARRRFTENQKKQKGTV